MTPSYETDLKAVPGLEGPKDLTRELWRRYMFPDGSAFTIDNPVALYYRKGGSTHRIVDADGEVHCIPFGTFVDDDGVVRAIPVMLSWHNRDTDDPPVGF